MVHMGMHDAPGTIKNHPHQHAFTIVGNKHFFGVHMTQFHCEVHKYQIILRLSMPEIYETELRAAREEHPDAFFVLCNRDAQSEWFTIPSLGSRMTTGFVANIFHGIPPTPADMDNHYFPWAGKYCDPMIADVPITIDRLALYRPFPHNDTAPKYATYWLFGEGDEAHITNLQTAGLASGLLEGSPQLYGTDIDTVISLSGAPDWLGQDQLRAGVPVSAPSIPLRDPATEEIFIPHEPPFEPGEDFGVLYRGIGDPQPLTAGPTYLHCAVVCNSPGAWPYPDGPCVITPMPEKYVHEYETA